MTKDSKSTTGMQDGVASFFSVDLAPWVQDQFKQLVHQAGHAHLLTGPAGLHQFDLAVHLAAAWLCDQPNASGAACRTCESCHMFEAHTHPDFKILLPEQLMIELALQEQDASTTEESKRKPSKEIRAEALRQMIEFSQKTRSRSKVQVVLIYPAERMNAISANTVLKTLEEPPGDVRFILATENASRLLPTIRSRCLTHAMRWPQEEEAIAWLKSLNIQEAQIVFAAAGGKPEQALQLVRQGMGAQRWVRIPQALAQGDTAIFDDLSATQMLDIASKLCHDLMAHRAGATPRFFEAALLPQKVKEKALYAWSKELMQASRVSEHPWNMPLYTQSLVATAQKILCP